MPAVTADQVGPKYDVLIATRDGTTLACLDSHKVAQNLSQVAYVCSTEQPQEEATEVQRKQQVTQLASAQIIDREFDAWPQVQQGDWSDGIGQRVFSGQGEALGTVSNKSTKYWDGLGVLWPITDYLPQQPVLATADQHEGGANMVTFGPGTASGYLVGLNGASQNCFVYLYQQSAAPQNNILVIQGDGVQRTITNPPGTAAGAGYSVDFMLAFGLLWYLAQSGTSLILDQITGAGPPVVTNQVTLASSTFLAAGLLASAMVGNRRYVAFLYSDNATNERRIGIYDVTASAFNAVNLQHLTADTGAAPLNTYYEQLEFLGDNLIVTAHTYNESLILQFNIASSTWTTLARFPKATDLYLCAIAGGLFIIAAVNSVSGGGPGIADMYLLQGGGLQYIDPLVVQATNQATGLLLGFSQPTAFGPYAVFVAYYLTGGANRAAVYAFDVLRGRIFRLADVATVGGTNAIERRAETFSTQSNHPFGTGTLGSQWGVPIPVLGNPGNTNVQRILVGVNNSSVSNFTPLLQQGVQITSSLIDFTSAQNKLYRQLVASFTPLPSDASISVRLDVWLDQDPSNLNSVPDFTTGVVANGVGGGVTGQTQLKLLINKVARKLVYRITTTGPSTTFTPAVKMQSVATQVSVGWAWHMFINLASSALCNDGMTACFSSQVSGVDELSAYNFIRQLWRLRGGECKITLPNGDSYNAILQLYSGKSPKPFGSSYNLAPSYQVVAEIRWREDV